MTTGRQEAFLRLRGPCVELGSVNLQFKAGRGTIKHVLAALNAVHDVLSQLSTQDVLDHKLAEYAFFPLTHIFNESKKLSSSCLEVAVNCVVILVTRGWRHHLLPAMGKQLLILMTLMSSSESSDAGNKPSDDLQTACFRCIKALLQWTKTEQEDSMKDSPRNVTDQVVYLLLEAIMTSSADQVQLTAAQALREVFKGEHTHLLLTSLLPRTVSGLTKVLKPSTQARRTQIVLAEYLQLLKSVLKSTLSDDLVFADTTGKTDSLRSELDASWLKATAPQVTVALTYVTRLRTHTGVKVRGALLELCLMIVQDCSRSLVESLPTMTETMILLAASDDLPLARESIEHLVTVDSNVSDQIRSKLYEWSRTLPRLMLAHDDQKRRDRLSEISMSFEILTKTMQMSPSLMNALGPSVLNALAGQMDVSKIKPKVTNVSTENADLSLTLNGAPNTRFPLVVLNHQSQAESRRQLQKLVGSFQSTSDGASVCRQWVDVAAESHGTARLSAIWLALEFLRPRSDDLFCIDGFVDNGIDGLDLNNTRPYLISDLYATVLPYLTESEPSGKSISEEWQLVALSLEALILQAQQLGDSYRPELVDTLYPILAILASPNQALQSHAITTLNLLASACQYQSVVDMLVQNVDYLVNSVALKLNAFDVTPASVKVVQMMLRLCGSQILPYLDDLVGSIFGILDSFHGYPVLVESLFGVLKAMVDESWKSYERAITASTERGRHQKHAYKHCSINDTLRDIKARRWRRVLRDQDLDMSSPSGNGAEDGQVNGDTIEGGISAAPKSLSTMTSAAEEGRPSRVSTILLSIAKAANPHLTSPSPQARQTLLQLLAQVAPLLAEDEDAFLPFVNDIWPSVVARLFPDQEPVPGEAGQMETSYNICTAALVVSALCQGAGDFMTSRIETMVPQLEKTYVQLYGKTHRRLQPYDQNAQLVQQGSVATESIRRGSHQVLDAYTGLMTVILRHVHVNGDIAGRLFEMLGLVYMSSRGNPIREVLVSYNSDAVWLLNQTRGTMT